MCSNVPWSGCHYWTDHNTLEFWKTGSLPEGLLANLFARQDGLIAIAFGQIIGICTMGKLRKALDLLWVWDLMMSSLTLTMSCCGNCVTSPMASGQFVMVLVQSLPFETYLIREDLNFCRWKKNLLPKSSIIYLCSSMACSSSFVGKKHLTWKDLINICKLASNVELHKNALM